MRVALPPGVGVAVGVTVGRVVPVAVAVAVGIDVGVDVVVVVAVAVSVGVAVAVGVSVEVAVTVGVAVGLATAGASTLKPCDAVDGRKSAVPPNVAVRVLVPGGPSVTWQAATPLGLVEAEQLDPPTLNAIIWPFSTATGSADTSISDAARLAVWAVVPVVGLWLRLRNVV